MSQVCSECHAAKAFEAFSIRKKDSAGGKKGERTAKCTECMKKENARKKHQNERKRKLQDDDNRTDDQGEDDVQDHHDETSLDPISFPAFLETLMAAKDEPMNIKACVHVPEAGALELGEKAHASRIAEILEDHLLWHWTYVSLSSSFD